jgi:hypothetical protein
MLACEPIYSHVRHDKHDFAFALTATIVFPRPCFPPRFRPVTNN